MKAVTIIGAGLAGTLCALFLARRGYQVDIYESRPDLRLSPTDYGRSINLALSCRGLTGLKAMDLNDALQDIMVPMRARAIHESNGEVYFQPFGRHHEEYINAISRTDLNSLLLNKAEESQRIQLHFDAKLIELDSESKTLLFAGQDKNYFSAHYELLIAADGAPSHIREHLQKQGHIQASREYLSHGYKELCISKEHSMGMVREHLHLWPRDAFMLLGNPNPDDSITGSLFLAHEGKDSFAALSDEIRLIEFFEREFPDALKAMPNLVGEFFGNPTGTMSTIKCAPWYYKDEILLIGDAAHGIIPFFGQGMNSAFEDCRILDTILDACNDDWSLAMPAFFEQRKINTDAVAAMSMDNYHEIHSDIRDRKFILRKQVELELMHRYPDRYVSKHILVMFTNTPYATARAYGVLQDQLLDNICASIQDLQEVAWPKVDGLIQEYARKLTEIKQYN